MYHNVFIKNEIKEKMCRLKKLYSFHLTKILRLKKITPLEIGSLFLLLDISKKFNLIFKRNKWYSHKM